MNEIDRRTGLQQSAFGVLAAAGFFLVCCMPPPRPATVPTPIKSPPRSSAPSSEPANPRKEKIENDTGKAMKTISPASMLMIKACDNYLSVNPVSTKTDEVLLIKASVFYNNKLMEESRNVYTSIIDRQLKGPQVLEAVKMVAQSFYEEKRFDEAQAWYRKLRDIAAEGGDKQEAIMRIAESIFKLAELYEHQQRFTDAATEYERVALEFPDSKIADVSLFNAGLAYEKQTEWSRSILMYQRLLQKYLSSMFMVKAQFRSAKCYEKLLQWDNAGETYLRVVANYPQSDLAPVALYNAGFCFENSNKPAAAAATFEKMAQIYPRSEEVADMLFKAGEIYGKIKDWSGVGRVNREFTKRFGSDAHRSIQAQCMVGVALYMQNKSAEAIVQLEQAVTSYDKLSQPSAVNTYYAAKAEFTIAEINYEIMSAIPLILPKEAYRKRLGDKRDALDKAISHYSKVLGYHISEWTTRSVFQIGQAYEDFALGIFKQERKNDLSLDERLALELGIAKAVDDYFINNAVHYHEQNIKLGIKEKIEDKYILLSRKKITSLPLLAGENYLALVDIAQEAASAQKLEGFALVARKLDILQKIAPFKERAIALFLKCLELGSAYRQIDECYNKSSGLITKNSCSVGETYADVASIARDAPIPASFDDYEVFVYKTKLLKQIETYESKALENYLRTLKIAEAYTIEDDFIKRVRMKIPELLFMRGRCYDLLSQAVVNHPPFPKNASDAEKEEFRGRFEEIGLRFQENAFDAYKSILSYAKQRYADGDFVMHAYVRMYQNFPKEYGVKIEKIDDKAISSGAEWKCFADSVAGWTMLDADDQAWHPTYKGKTPEQVAITGFPDKVPAPMWYGEVDLQSAMQYKPAKQLYVRRIFYCAQVPRAAWLYCAAIDQCDVFFNGERLPKDTSSEAPWHQAQKWNLFGKVREGKNVIGIFAKNNITAGHGVFPYLQLMETGYDYIPQLPGSLSPLDPKFVAEGAYAFPTIKNF